ncbi:hypothetical protein V2J09_004833 [Rumex salicifolius]
MAVQSRKWMILMATIWIQAFTGTNFDFSAYSSELKSVLGISQVQLNYLATASDFGKAVGWSSGLALLYLPLPVVMFIAAFMGVLGYGIQWLLIRSVISLPYIAFYFARTGWLALAVIPTPVAFFLLAGSGSSAALHIGTALIGLSSGFIFAAAVCITSELFGPNSVGVNHNILITNIPIGSLVYGLIAAMVYDSNATSSNGIAMATDSVVCLGTQCYFWTFVWLGFTSLVGFLMSILLFVRTRLVYDSFERDRTSIYL